MGMDVSSLIIDLKDELKESIQIEERVRTQVEMTLERVSQNEADIRDVYDRLADHAERLVALETSEETLEQRAVLWIERALRSEEAPGDTSDLIES